ncbi:hypothetical protein NDA17_003063 [Ustilago hordei]|nr:hypothetical protein NDA17_003063 [Ustilago hordei]
MARSGEPSRSQSTSRRSDELFAAFNGPADIDPGLPGCKGASSSNRRSTDVFFDAGDALPALDSHHDNNTSATDSDPLGANRANTASSASAPSTFRQPALFNRTGATPAYDFERPEYFPIVTRRPPPTSSRPDAANHGTADANASSNGNSNSNSAHQTTIDMEGDDSMHSAGGGGSGVTRNGYSSLPTSFSGGEAVAGGSTHDENMSRSDRLRFALGRFGRFVGMGIPGARYSSLSQQDGSRAGVHRPRLVGGGIGQDGVFANLSAKPERRRRGQNTGTTDDRGDDDDLEDDAQPPTYEIAAADAVPQYWETTILGGSVHPLANGLGWVPGGAHVGAIEDLIVEGLAVGNLFGFAWNLLVSMTFQFVGFLLTYLLHTTHAARCGSRAGLGVTLIQYGFYLRTRASEMAEGKIVDTSGGFGSGGSYFSWSRLGWVVWWAKSLVDAAHREQESSDPPQETSSGETADATSIVNRFRSLFGSRDGNGAGSGEDWVLFPGIGHRLGRSGGGGGGSGSARDHPTSIADLEDDDGLDTEDATLNPAERRLLADMRRVGLA